MSIKLTNYRAIRLSLIHIFQELNRFVTIKLTTSAIKTISKIGTAHIAKLISDKQIKVR